MLSQETKARVFISCGQKEDSEECRLSRQIAEILSSEAFGFEPFVATEQQSLQGVKDLLGVVADSEYFLFVDFARDGADPSFSLFSHQELAVATHFEKEFLGFVECRKKRPNGTEATRRGILGCIPANLGLHPFDDRSKLPGIVCSAVRDLVNRKRWDPHWKDRLVLTRNPSEYSDTIVNKGTPDEGPARFFHIEVKNQNRNKAAVNSCVYLESVLDIASGKESTIPTGEIKWEGWDKTADVLIGPKTERWFDAIWILKNEPKLEIRFSVLNHSKRVTDLTKIRRHGNYELTFVVISQNFQSARGTFQLHLGDTLAEFQLVQRIA